MARTRALDYEDRQRQILQAAARLFAERGYSETLLEDIAAACGAGKSSLYHYYRSKQAILHGLVRWKIDDLAWKVDAAIEQMAGAGPREKLQALAETLIGEYLRAPQEVTVLLTQTRHLEPEALAATNDIQERLIRRAVLLLREIRPDAEMPRKKGTALAMLLFGMINWIHVWYDEAGSIRPAELAGLIVGVYLDGFVNQPAAALA